MQFPVHKLYLDKAVIKRTESATIKNIACILWAADNLKATQILVKTEKNYCSLHNI
jgi:hypothetical protein